MTNPARIVVMASGGGRTLENLAARCANGALRAEIVEVILSKSGLQAEARAKHADLPHQVISRETHASREDRDRAIVAAWDQAQPDWIVLAGWLQLVPIPPRYEGKVLNIHPALLPAYGGPGCYGHHVHEAVLRDGRPYSGCTVHFASDAYDEGPIVLQDFVCVPANASADELAALVFAAERRAYPEALAALIDGHVRWVNGQLEWR